MIAMNKLKLKPIQVKFDAKKHWYELNGELLPGVTTIIAVKNQEFLKWWTVKEMYRFMLDKQGAIQKMSPDEYLNLLEEGKKAHTHKTQKAIDAGHEAHAWIENYIKAKIEEKKLTQKLPENLQAQNAVKAFLEWEKFYKVEWFVSELLVYSARHQFAGTLDAVALVNGILTVIDFKTSKAIYSEMRFQVSAYQAAAEEESGKEYSGNKWLA